jgi:pimeloyl-ACP methyl ester carboxylesterase
LQRTDPAGYASCCAVIRDADFRDELSSIATPTLVISGTYDPVTPPADGHFLSSHIPGARYLELPTAHLSNLGDAAAFNSALRDFLLR